MGKAPEETTQQNSITKEEVSRIFCYRRLQMVTDISNSITNTWPFSAANNLCSWRLDRTDEQAIGKRHWNKKHLGSVLQIKSISVFSVRDDGDCWAPRS
jgi:hypothetical protein